MSAMPRPVSEKSTSSATSHPLPREKVSPFVHRHGRRCLRDASTYPLPVDLSELNRHNIRTLLLMQVFGAPFCSNFSEGPRKILEVACGLAMWSSSCHQYLRREGYGNVSFTGVDIAPIAPDLRKHGVDWRFVQHDMRKSPLPFDDAKFDFIFVNNEFILVGDDASFNPINALARYLKPGGTMEVWRTDLQYRSLQPDPPVAIGAKAMVADQAERTATYTIGAATPLTNAQNAHLQDCNVWIEKALKKFGLTAAPCAIISFDFSTSEPGLYSETNSRRIAIPFGPKRWESEYVVTKLSTYRVSGGGKGVRRPSATVRKRPFLTPDQAALRRTALEVAIDFIESMEPLLMEESGKTSDEWDRWWANLNTDLLEKDGTLNGECLELGAWWACKA